MTTTKIDFSLEPPFFLRIRHGENWINSPRITKRDIEEHFGPGADLSSPMAVHLRDIIMRYMFDVGMPGKIVEKAFVELVKWHKFESVEGE